jgi:hypothetical protein
LEEIRCNPHSYFILSKKKKEKQNKPNTSRPNSVKIKIHEVNEFPEIILQIPKLR